MSKELFSKKISETMYKKIKAIEYLDLKTLLEKDEDFEIAICLAYMSLSKEKIIEKDIKNDDRLARLTQKVDTIEIDKVFQTGFAKEMPKIIYARENNNLWILDNIRDSIMHGAFDIDEERKIFIINNTQHNRELNAEIPFSWFIAYAKNDLLSKKISNNYTIKNYYYNKAKKNQKNFYTHKELVSNILYRVNIYGNNFNIMDIESRINELFMLYSNDEISDEMVEKCKSQIDNEKIKYNEKYLASFYIAKQKVIDIINKEFPDVTIKIFIDNRKYRFVNKAIKRMPQYFTDYDTMYNVFNNILSPKGISLLRFISSMIVNINVNQNTDEDEYKNSLDWKKTTIMLHKLLTGESVSSDKSSNLLQILNQDLKILRSIYLNIYGLSTLVINHETLYNTHFLNRKPSEFGLQAHLKRPYLEYANKRKKLIMKGLDIQILLANKQEQLNKCNNIDAKKKIQVSINDLTIKLVEIEKDLNNLVYTIGFDQVIKSDNVNYQEQQRLDTIINQYFIHFNSANIDAKKKIRKVIGKLLDIQIEKESKYIYGYCNNMKDVLTIIRNCFSHIGRIYIGKNNGTDTNIILNDYDTNGEKSGEVICRYIDLIELLRDPYEVANQNKQHGIV